MFLVIRWCLDGERLRWRESAAGRGRFAKPHPALSGRDYWTSPRGKGALRMQEFCGRLVLQRRRRRRVVEVHWWMCATKGKRSDKGDISFLVNCKRLSGEVLLHLFWRAIWRVACFLWLIRREAPRRGTHHSGIRSHPLNFHVTLQSAHMRPIKKRLTHESCYKLLRRAPLNDNTLTFSINFFNYNVHKTLNYHNWKAAVDVCVSSGFSFHYEFPDN